MPPQTIIMHQHGALPGDLEGPPFTVPEGFQGGLPESQCTGGANLESLSLSSREKVRLGYLLLPEFAANRIQGLWANQNAIQRVEFWRDGLKIYQESPIIRKRSGLCGGHGHPGPELLLRQPLCAQPLYSGAG